MAEQRSRQRYERSRYVPAPYSMHIVMRGTSVSPPLKLAPDGRVMPASPSDRVSLFIRRKTDG